MLKRFDARLWTMGALVPMILAGCSATAPTATKVAPAAPAVQPANPVPAKYAVQGGADLSNAYVDYAGGPCGECPAAVPALGVGVLVSPFALWTFDYLSAHPLLDYSWYYLRGNFATFGWAPGFYSNLGNFLWYPTAAGYWPYAFDGAAGAYLPYSTVYGGAPIYPYLGLPPYAGLGYGPGVAAPVLSEGLGTFPTIGYGGGYGGVPDYGAPGPDHAGAYGGKSMGYEGNGHEQAYSNGKDKKNGMSYGNGGSRNGGMSQGYGMNQQMGQQQMTQRARR